MKKLIVFLIIAGCYACTCWPQISTQYIQADENCEGVLPNYLEFVTVKDNCQEITPTQDPLSGTILDAANPWVTVTLEAKDAFNNTDQKKFDVILIDNAAPELIIDSLGFTDTIAYHRNDIDELIKSYREYRAHLGDTILADLTWKSLKLWFQ